MTTAFLPLLQRGSEQEPRYTSTVINISSTSGMVNSSESHFPAGACKAGTIQLTKVLASEFARTGLKIRINSIAPGIFPSEITTKTSDPVTQKSELPEDYPSTKDIAAGRPGNDSDMANAVLFLATNQYLNGQVIAVDGGYLLKHGRL
jgi:NAD(P)-dependent dehydrogenase (short-subunit alcohol dehydrogenase family)